MALLDNVLSALEKWPRWKRVSEAPERIDELERRVAVLEAALARCPGEGCPHCGEREYRVDRVERHPHRMIAGVGGRMRFMKCGACGFADQVPVIPGK